MTVDSNFVPTDPEDSFLLAVERLEAGVALEIVLADFPVAEREELRELLTVVAATHHLQGIDIPRPAPERRAAGKRAFLQAAATMKSTTAAANRSAAAPAAVRLDSNTNRAVASSAASRVTSTQSANTTASLGSRLAAWWTNLLGSFAPMSLRLAPLAAMLAAIWLGAFSVVNVAQAAIPGQAAYLAKTWIFAQKLTLSDEEDRLGIYKEFTTQFKTDNAMAGILAAKENKIVPSRADLVIDNIGRTHIEMGGLLFELSYRESLNSDVMLPTQIKGLPAEGAQAHVEYQIAPDPNGPPGATVLQGISLTIEEEPLVIPTAAPTTVESAEPGVTNRACSATIPAGWVTYRVPGGLTLSEIAQQTGTNVFDLTRVNCIVNPDKIRAGEVIMVPMVPVVITTPAMPTATAPPLLATLTGISTTQPTPLITVTMPAEGTPAVAITSTIDSTPVGTVTPGLVITGTLVATTTTPAMTPEPATTVSMTATVVVPSVTPTTTVVMPVVTPTATPIASETIAITPAETVEPAEEGTPVAPTATLSLTLTAVATTGHATAVETVVATPTSAEDVVGGASSGGDEATALPPPTTTPVPTNTLAPPTILPTPTILPSPTVTVGGHSNGGNSGDSPNGPLPTATPTAVSSSPLQGSGA